MSQMGKSIFFCFVSLFLGVDILLSQSGFSADSTQYPIFSKFVSMHDRMIDKFSDYERIKSILRRIKKESTIKENLKEKEKKEINLILSLLEFGASKDIIMDDSILFSRALISFQKRHRMTETGKLNETLKRRILNDLELSQKKLKNSIKRLEKFKFNNGGLVYINIPDYSMVYYDSVGFEILNCPVIVGKPSWPTKPLSSKIDNVVFCPYWNVPTSIFSKEIMPMIRKNPTYVSDNRMEWVGGRLRQRPGFENALGYIKFNFSNPYHIYLHDTPNKNYFKKQRRAISHGCIRLSCVEELAMELLTKDREWLNQQKNTCDNGNEKKFRLFLNTKILVTYLTAWVDEKGVVQVRDDIYGWDR